MSTHGSISYTKLIKRIKAEHEKDLVMEHVSLDGVIKKAIQQDLSTQTTIQRVAHT